MNYSEMMNLKKLICLEYIIHYENKGYINMPPLPLDSKEDVTLDFTTCTICAAKKNIREMKKGKDYVLIQPALRNTHIDVLSKIGGDNAFFSFFSMMGGFKYYSNENNFKKEFNEVLKNEFDFLCKYAKQVILTIPIQYKDFLEIDNQTLNYLNSKKCIIKYSENDEKNLKWKYGINNVEGYGTRWEICNGGDIVNWGNTINVYVNGKPFGVDFGGGVESLVYANQNLKSSIYANDAMTDLIKDFCYNNNIHEKIIDCVISSMCTIANKENIILRNKYILQKYLSILNSLMILTNVSKDNILAIVEDINSKKIPFLYKENMEEIFEEYLKRAEYEYSILLNRDNIDIVLKLVELCYNEDNDLWKKSKKITKSHCVKYFSNLSDVELLSLHKSKETKVLRKEKKHD